MKRVAASIVLALTLALSGVAQANHGPVCGNTAWQTSSTSDGSFPAWGWGVGVNNMLVSSNPSGTAGTWPAYAGFLTLTPGAKVQVYTQINQGGSSIIFYNTNSTSYRWNLGADYPLYHYFSSLMVRLCSNAG